MASAGGWASTVGGAIFLGTDQPATIEKSVFSGNMASASAASGTAQAAGGAIFFPGPGTLSIRDSAFTRNRAQASSILGLADAGGGAFQTGAVTTLTNTTVDSNTVAANGPTGSAQGGGIWNGDMGNGPPQLTLQNSSVRRNTVTGTAGATLQGGGLHDGSCDADEQCHRRELTGSVLWLLRRSEAHHGAAVSHIHNAGKSRAAGINRCQRLSVSFKSGFLGYSLCYPFSITFGSIRNARCGSAWPQMLPLPTATSQTPKLFQFRRQWELESARHPSRAGIDPHQRAVLVVRHPDCSVPDGDTMQGEGGIRLVSPGGNSR